MSMNKDLSLERFKCRFLNYLIDLDICLFATDSPLSFRSELQSQPRLKLSYSRHQTEVSLTLSTLMKLGR